MNILVVNLTRFGDILQSQAALSGLAAQGHTTAVLCLDNFAPAARLLDNVEHVAVLPGGRLLTALDEDWRGGAGQLHLLVREWRRAFRADAVLNLTPTLSGRVLARLLAGGELPIQGFGLDEFGFGVNGNIWTSFLQASTLRRLSCPFNLVDVFRRVCGVGEIPAAHRLREPDPDLRARMGEELERAAPAGRTGFVAFQLGASETRRQWPVEYFAALGDRLWKERRVCPVLLGSPAEARAAEEYARAASAPFVNRIGATSLPELAALLPAARLLVTNDTGTMHLAAGLGVPVLAIFLATAQAWDTGPYLEGSCCLEPDLPCHPCAFGSACPENEKCRRRISAETAGELALSRLDAGVWTPGERARAEARIWLSRMPADGHMGLVCLSGHEEQDRSLWIALQREAYRHILDGTPWEAGPRAFPPASARTFSRQFSAPVLETLGRAEALLQLMGEQGALLERMPGARTGRRLLDSAMRLRLLLDECVPLNTLGYLWFVLMQERGGSLPSLLECAASLRDGIRHWREHMEAMT